MSGADSAAPAPAASTPPKLGEKFPARSFGPCSMEDLRRYAAVSGDDNPIHLDPEIARRAGLAAPPVHGMLLMSQFEPTLESWRHDLALMRLSAKFLRPVLVGEEVTFSGRVAQITAGAPTTYLLRLMMHNARGELAIIAEAVTVLKPVA